MKSTYFDTQACEGFHGHTHTYIYTLTHSSDAISPSQQVALGDNKVKCVWNIYNSLVALHAYGVIYCDCFLQKQMKLFLRNQYSIFI